MILLGSTGSIGVNTLNIAREFGLSAEVLVAGTNMTLLKEQIEEFHPRIVVVGSHEAAKQLGPIDAKLFIGEEGILEALNLAKGRLVVNALVGYLGLKPTLEAIRLGKKVALANKESLVVAGRFIDMTKITPIDSEHFALWYLLNGRPVSKMVITASGGPFRDRPLDALHSVSVDEALKHPNWSMGQKITIDSATMTNKLFELLEARWLFGPSITYDAIIEPRSLVHALVEFVDGVTTMQLSVADMRLPIAYAVIGEVEKPLFGHIDLLELQTLSFRPIETARYPIWELKELLLARPELGVVVNAANEVAVEAFLRRQCSFLDISKTTLKAVKAFDDVVVQSLDDVIAIDQEVRKFCLA
ncbi:MAG: 1-deoxy-D-xylulose-5-phosphate reductoisomerase [Campylobacterales bacterium]